jgi:predicted solute-binding protein
MQKKSKQSEIDDQLRKKVTASLADPRKNIAASKVFKHLRGGDRSYMEKHVMTFLQQVKCPCSSQISMRM